MTRDALALWRETSQILSRTLSHQRLRTWVLPLTPIALEDGVLRLAAPNEFLRQGIEAHYLSSLREALSQAGGKEIQIEVEVDPSLRFGQDDEAESVSTAPSLNPEFTFETFVVGPCNRLAHASAIAVTDSPGNLYNPLLIYGPAGVGKTHLLQAFCHRLLGRRARLSLVSTSCRAFINGYIAALESDRLGEFRDRFEQAEVLAVDNIHLLATRPQAQEEFYHTFNTLHDSGRQIVLSSAAAPQDIESLEPRLASRLNWGLIARIEEPVFETRAAIIRRKTSMRGVSLNEEVVRYLADLPCRGVRELEAALTRVLAYSSLSGRGLDVELAREALSQREEFKGRPALDDIIGLVSRHFGLGVEEILSTKRSKSVVLPRQVSMYLAKRLTRHSLDEIGGYFGGRDHTTVVHALSRVADRSEGDSQFRRLLINLESELLSKAS